jgi:mono/diheme cytochrome c family protein
VRLVILVAVLVLAVAVVGCSDPVEGKYGKDLYRATCAHCHGADFGGGIGPAIGAGSNAAVNLTDVQIAGVIEVGPGAMPPYRNRLDDEQVASVIEYLRSIQDGGG